MQYIAAVSGGPDSMCMLDMYKKNIDAVCHVNYKKRQSADRDMQIVKHFCSKNKIRFFLLIINKKKLDKYLKINKNFQNAARLIRYDFFNQCANKIKNFNLIVAHTKSDFLETALMQKQRNSKALFLGIQEHSKYKYLNVYRPILNMTKNETLAYCLKNKILYGIDETNEMSIYERNIVRKEIKKWTQNKINDEYKEIIDFNNRNKSEFELINHEYEQWLHQNYNLKYLLNVDKSHYQHLIYKMLIDKNIVSISTNKINGIINFIKANNKVSKFRLGNKYYLTKQNNSLIIHCSK